MKISIDKAVELFSQFLKARVNCEIDTTREVIKRDMVYWIIEHRAILLEYARKEDEQERKWNDGLPPKYDDYIVVTEFGVKSIFHFCGKWHDTYGVGGKVVKWCYFPML